VRLLAGAGAFLTAVAVAVGINRFCVFTPPF